jgi:hypothetical protein
MTAELKENGGSSLGKAREQTCGWWMHCQPSQVVDQLVRFNANGGVMSVAGL